VIDEYKMKAAVRRDDLSSSLVSLNDAPAMFEWVLRHQTCTKPGHILKNDINSCSSVSYPSGRAS